MKSGSLNLLGPSGLVQAFTGIASPLPLLWLQYLDTKLMGETHLATEKGKAS
jgi:hypothetical protein